jgi:transcription elongation factor Elf1
MTMIPWQRLRALGNATLCPNCGKEAIQSIELGTDETVITCMNCGVARHYAIDGVRLETRFDEDVPKG